MEGRALTLILTDTAAKQTLSRLDDSCVCSSGRELRTRAQSILRELLGVGTPQLGVVHRPSEDAFDIFVPESRLNLRGKPGDRPDEFIVFSIRLNVPGDTEQRPWNKLIELRFYDPATRPSFVDGVTREFWSNVETLPVKSDYIDLIYSRLEDWEAYLGVVEQLAEEKKFSVQYESFRTDDNWVTVCLKIGEVSSEIKDRLKNSFRDRFDIDLGAGSTEELGVLINYKPGQRRIVLELEETFRDAVRKGRVKLPERAVLHYNAHGELTDIRRQRTAMKRLANGQAKNQNLPSLLFNLREFAQVRPRPKPDTYLFLNPNLDQYQQEAVVGALESEDVFLIKGPPGTGKTTVIAELCAQAIKRGRRVLVSSQSNLAVDNVLAKFQGQDVVLPIRYGNLSSIDEQALCFLPGRVVKHWLSVVKERCREQWDAYCSSAAILTELEAIFQFADEYLRLVEQVDELQQEAERSAHDAAVNRESLERLASSRRELAAFLKDLEETEHLLRSRSFAALRGKLTALNLPRLSSAAQFESLRNEVQRLEKRLREAQIGAPTSSAGSDQLSVLVKALDLYTWNQSHHLKLRASIGQAESFGDRFSAYLSQKEGYLKNRDSWEALRRTLDENERAAQELERSLKRQRADLDQLQLLTSTDLRPVVEQCLTGSNGSLKAALQGLPVLDGLSSDLQRRLTASLENMVTGQWSALLTAAESVRQLRRSLDYARTIIHSLEEAEVAVDAAIIERAEDNSMLATTFEQRFTNETMFQLVDPQNPSGDAMALVEANVTRLVKGWQKGSTRSVSDDLFSLFDPAARFFGLKTHQERRNERLNNDLRMIWAGLRVMRRVTPQWEQLAAAAEQALFKQRQQVAVLLQRAIKQCATTLAGSCQQEIVQTEKEKLALESRITVQRRVERSHSVQVEKLRKDLASAKSTLDRMLDQAGFAVVLPSFGMLVQEFQETTPQDVDRSFAERWAKQCSEVQAVLSELNEFDAPLHLARVLGIVRETGAAQSRALQEQAAAAEEALLRCDSDHAALCARLSSLRTDLADPRREWEAKHVRLHALVKLPLGYGDIHSAGYLRSLREVYPEVIQELHGRYEVMAAAEDFGRAWLQSLENLSEYDEDNLLGFYLDHVNLVGATCSFTGKEEFTRFGDFDLVIVDEVSKATPPELLLPLLHGKTLVLVGDDKQLPPMIGDEAIKELAEELGVNDKDLDYIKRSLFAQLWNESPDGYKAMLKKQYRMHSGIMDVINQFYDYELEHGDRRLDAKRTHGCGGGLFSTDVHAVWIDLPQHPDYREKKIGTSWANETEVTVIKSVLWELNEKWADRIRAGEPPKKVGVITFYAAQEGEIRRSLEASDYPHLEIKIGTVDRFQGMEYPIVIVSMVRNNSEGKVGHASVPERVNVALSRAQELLILIGCGRLFCDSSHPEARKIYGNVRNTIAAQGGMLDVYRFLMD